MPLARPVSRRARPCATWCCRRRCAAWFPAAQRLRVAAWDVSLVSVLGVYEGVRQAQIYTERELQLHAVRRGAAIFLVVTIR